MEVLGDQVPEETQLLRRNRGKTAGLPSCLQEKELKGSDGGGISNRGLMGRDDVQSGREIYLPDYMASRYQASDFSPFSM
jgi:hypothetical protein